MQRVLSANQLGSFYHSQFVSDQIDHFTSLIGSEAGRLVLDIGGGVGFFAQGLHERLGLPVRVVDLDPVSIEKCRQRGIDAVQSDATGIVPTGDESVVCFNLILHHLVGSDARSTWKLQSKALALWRSQRVKVFVNEYIYESFVPGFSGALIYGITSSKWLSTVARLVSKIVPAFRANTLGVGVRFRGEAEWVKLFREAGFTVEGRITGQRERVDLPLRALLIRSINRSSFLLVPAA
jgi:hypothetical protein